MMVLTVFLLTTGHGILDSIRYAERIQISLLHIEDIVKSCLPESFILDLSVFLQITLNLQTPFGRSNSEIDSIQSIDPFSSL